MSYVVSNCCGARILYTDICGDCKEHCSPVYDEKFCDSCGGSILEEDDCCDSCGKIYIEEE